MKLYIMIPSQNVNPTLRNWNRVSDSIKAIPGACNVAVLYTLVAGTHLFSH